MGLLNFEQSYLPQARNYLLKHFDLAKGLDNGRLVDAARINLGIAEANTNESLAKYKSMILNDFDGMLDWKISRKMADK